jgi:transposase-like protein
MKAKRKRHAPEFKAKVALEAVKSILTVQQIAKAHDVHPVQVSEWKRTLLDSAREVFNPGAAISREDDFELERERLHAKIGQLSVELDFLRKKSKQLGL